MPRYAEPGWRSGWESRFRERSIFEWFSSVSADPGGNRHRCGSEIATLRSHWQKQNHLKRNAPKIYGFLTRQFQAAYNFFVPFLF